MTGTADGLAKAAYVRESRRIKAVTTVTEHDVSIDLLGPYGRTRHRDSVGVGNYRIDLHPSTGGDGYVDIGSVPFEIPLGALVPRRVRNLLPASTRTWAPPTSPTAATACTRWSGTSARSPEPSPPTASPRTSSRTVQAEDKRFEEFARVLDHDGVQRHWPDVRGY